MYSLDFLFAIHKWGFIIRFILLDGFLLLFGLLLNFLFLCWFLGFCLHDVGPVVDLIWNKKPSQPSLHHNYASQKNHPGKNIQDFTFPLFKTEISIKFSKREFAKRIPILIQTLLELVWFNNVIVQYNTVLYLNGFLLKFGTMWYLSELSCLGKPILDKNHKKIG